MNKIWLTAGLLAGCASPKAGPTRGVDTPPLAPATAKVAATSAATQATPDPVIATVGTTKVTAAELQQPLVEAYGFNLLMLIVQRDLARDACAAQNIKVTPQDVAWEYDWTLSRMFPNLNADDDREKLLDQYLAQPKPKDQTTTRTELGIIIDTNAHLRKLVEPTVSRGVTEEMLQAQFDETYGAQVQVRHIVVDNPQDAMAVRRRLDAGEDFAAVARQISRDPTTKRLGGELPPFTINSTRLPDNFKRVAFSLKPGEVSDPVQAGGGYHLIKLEKRIAPKAVKFEDVKDSLRQDSEAALVADGVKNIRGRLAQQALAQLKINDPTLKAEFDKRLNARDAVLKDREKIREQLEKDRETARQQAAAAAATQPTTNPAAAATSKPMTTPPVATAPSVPTPATRPPAATTPATAPAVVTPPVVVPATPASPAATKPAVVAPPSTAPTPVAATPPAATKPAVTPPPVIPTPAPATTPTATTMPAAAPTPTPAPATTASGIDPATGLPLAATPGNVRTGVAPVGVVPNSGGFTTPHAAAAATAPAATQPTTRP